MSYNIVILLKIFLKQRGEVIILVKHLIYVELFIYMYTHTHITLYLYNNTMTYLKKLNFTDESTEAQKD